MKSVQPFWANRDEGRAFWFTGTLVILLATGEQTGGQFGLIEEVDPPGYSPPLHVHHAEDEAFYILEGQVTFTIGDQTIHAVPGTYVYAPRGIPHIFRVEGEKPARMLTYNFPSGFEQFFVEMGTPAPALTLPPAGTADDVDMDRLLELCKKYQLEVLDA